MKVNSVCLLSNFTEFTETGDIGIKSNLWSFIFSCHKGTYRQG